MRRWSTTTSPRDAWRAAALPLVGLFLLTAGAGCAGRAAPPAAYPAPGASAAAASPAAPRSIILLIGDGTGLAYWSAARMDHAPLNVERMDVVGLVDTRPDEERSGRVTDSGASATAYAAGIRTYNGAIGVDADSQAVETILERAELLGMATGLVATSSVTHATPAAFAAHVPDRGMQAEIARQMVSAGVDVILGGGRGWFDGTLRPDSLDLLTALRVHYTVLDSAGELAAGAAGAQRLLGLFTQGAMPPAGDRSPTLAEMTDAALRVLQRDPDGFLLVAEGSQIDWRGHDNEPLEVVVREVLDLDAAVGVALDHAAANPGTLEVVTADHETGGLALHPAEGGGREAAVPEGEPEGHGGRADFEPLRAHYTTTHHTAEMVPLFAHGPGAARLGRLLDNDELGRRLRALLEEGRP